MYYGKDFTRRLKKIKAELLALKQAHEYGLGLADFPLYKVDVDWYAGNPSDVIRVQLTYNQAFMPMFYIMNGLDLYRPRISWDSANKTLTIEEERFDIAGAYIVSTAVAESFSYEVLP